MTKKNAYDQVFIRHTTAAQLADAITIESAPFMHVEQETDDYGEITLKVGRHAVAIQNNYEDDPTQYGTHNLTGWTIIALELTDEMICDCPPIEGWVERHDRQTSNLHEALAFVYAWLMYGCSPVP